MKDCQTRVFYFIPKNDLIPHDTRLPLICRCKPTVYVEKEIMIIYHNSFDHREAIEEMLEELKIMKQDYEDWEIREV
jgi:hypothetical protein